MFSPQLEPKRKVEDAFERALQLLCIQYNRCPECRGTLRQIEDEMVCTECGLVVDRVFHPEQRIPINETRSPTCRLATDNSLGTTMRKRDLYRILNRDSPPKNIECPKCGYVLEIKSGVVPACQIKSVIDCNKHPIITRMDLYASELQKKWLNSIVGEGSDLSRSFAKKLSRTIDKVAKKELIPTNDGHNLKGWVEGCFLWTWTRMNLPNPEKVFYNIRPNKNIPELRIINQIMNS